jgi:hypothetical protein
MVGWIGVVGRGSGNEGRLLLTTGTAAPGCVAVCSDGTVRIFEYTTTAVLGTSYASFTHLQYHYCLRDPGAGLFEWWGIAGVSFMPCVGRNTGIPKTRP